MVSAGLHSLLRVSTQLRDSWNDYPNCLPLLETRSSRPRRRQPYESNLPIYPDLTLLATFGNILLGRALYVWLLRVESSTQDLL
jgi:hypothetical protein